MRLKFKVNMFSQHAEGNVTVHLDSIRIEGGDPRALLVLEFPSPTEDNPYKLENFTIGSEIWVDLVS